MDFLNTCKGQIPYLLMCYLFDADIEPLQNNPDLEEGFCKALLCRLRFRKVLPYDYSFYRLYR